MEPRYVLCSERGLYLCRGEHGWQGPQERGHIQLFKHFDEALNSLIELNAKDITLRARVVEVELDQRNLPKLPDKVNTVTSKTQAVERDFSNNLTEMSEIED